MPASILAGEVAHWCSRVIRIEVIFDTSTHTLAFIVLLPPVLWVRHLPLQSSLLVGSGKPTPGPQVTMSLQGLDCTVLNVSNEDTGTTYVIDSGAEVSILPCTARPMQWHRTYAPPPHSLYMAESPLSTCGSLIWILHFSRCPFTGQFLLSHVKEPIIGTDFLLKHQLLVDVSRCRLLLPSLSC